MEQSLAIKSFAIILISISLIFPGSHLSRAAGVWYVAPGGNDNNSCTASDLPCATIQGAINKSDSSDSIHITVGIYTSISEEVILIQKNLILSGGWNSNFTQQTGYSTIDGASSRRGITVGPGLTATIERFTIENGYNLDKFGAGIFIDFQSQLTLKDSIVRENSWEGIRIGNYGALTIDNCLIESNDAGEGGGIHAGVSPINLNNTELRDNHASGRGGGIYSEGEVTLNNSTVRDNTAHWDGGGISALNGTVSLTNSDILNNYTDESGGGIYGNNITILRSVVAYNSAVSGGGIKSIVGDVNINNSSIIGNTAESGGGIESFGILYMTNSTVAGNQAISDNYSGIGGGLYGGGFEISNSTISDNHASHSGGGIYGNPTTLRNTMLAGNTANEGPDCYTYEYINSDGYNLLGNTIGCNFLAGVGDKLNTYPETTPLTGWPPFEAIYPSSPAIDAGNPAGCVNHNGIPIITDQRGSSRAVDGNGDGSAICDIGAFELDPDNPLGWAFLPMITWLQSNEISIGIP